MVLQMDNLHQEPRKGHRIAGERVVFEVTEAFKLALETAAVRRRMSVRELCTLALAKELNLNTDGTEAVRKAS